VSEPDRRVRLRSTQLVKMANDLVVLGYPTDRVKTERFGPTGG
jgi:hypothetical protein